MDNKTKDKDYKELPSTMEELVKLYGQELDIALQHTLKPLHDLVMDHITGCFIQSAVKNIMVKTHGEDCEKAAFGFHHDLLINLIRYFTSHLNYAFEHFTGLFKENNGIKFAEKYIATHQHDAKDSNILKEMINIKPKDKVLH